ncbi:MerR family DNA-binding transcriptional regulator [Streptosporangium canum]|uniref:MerR family DNA-binding transcriptional regulator n=1 Tax=Streptosporangium canum TaxID=324952 RepID=UPI0037B3A099
MFSIGDFAQLGLVSVRMLRHYDALGLLQPARVDPASGYRFYQASQLSRLSGSLRPAWPSSPPSRGTTRARTSDPSSSPCTASCSSGSTGPG